MIVLDIGRRGLGKTTLAEWRASQLNRNRVAFDPRGQYRSFGVQTSDLKKVEKEFSRDWSDDAPLSLSYRPAKIIENDGSINDRELEENWNQFARLLWEYTGEDDGCASYVLIVDEAQNLMSPQYMNGWLNTYIRETPTRERGDANPVDLVLTAHRLQDFHGSVSSQVNEIYLFNMIRPRDLKVIEDEWGNDLAEQVRNLRTPKSNPSGRDVLFIDPETGETRLMTDPKEWYVDIRQPGDEAKGSSATERMADLRHKYGAM